MAYSSIKDPSAHFQTKLYTGTGSSLALTNDGNSDLKPDFAWIKRRTTGGNYSHALFDSSRGSTKRIYLPGPGNEDTNAQYITSFNTDGFTAGTDANINENNLEYVAWQWKANGGTTASNSDGSITSTVQANTDAGFSIVTYTGTGSAATVGHGLGVTPDMIIFKNRSSTNVWAIYHQSLGNNLKLELNGTGAQDADGAFMNGTLPTSSVFSVGASANTNTGSSNYVAYCFASKQGYSKFGTYIANGDVNGPFIYTGFKPAFFMVKNNRAGQNWLMVDAKRDPNNLVNHGLLANSAAPESTAVDFNVDFLSNGIKIRTVGTGWFNMYAGDEYYYMAFAESPFTTSTGIPTTAR